MTTISHDPIFINLLAGADSPAHDLAAGVGSNGTAECVRSIARLARAGNGKYALVPEAAPQTGMTEQSKPST